jgi:DNA-binding NarL/FixJ family response regulator
VDTSAAHRTATDTAAQGEPTLGIVQPALGIVQPALGIVADEVNRRRLEGLLERGSFALAGSAGSVEELLDQSAELDLVVLAGSSGVVARTGPVQLLRTLRPACSIVIVAPDDDGAIVRKALRAGADGYVPEPLVEEALAVTISAVLAGQLSIPRSIRRRAPWSAFSARERQVLELVGSGYTNQNIAERLHLSVSTVKTHLTASFRKLGVSSRAEAATAVLDSETGLQASGCLFTPVSPFKP